MVPFVILFSVERFGLDSKIIKMTKNIGFDAYHCPFVCDSLLFVGFLQALPKNPNHLYTKKKPKHKKKFHKTV